MKKLQYRRNFNTGKLELYINEPYIYTNIEDKEIELCKWIHYKSSKHYKPEPIDSKESSQSGQVTVRAYLELGYTFILIKD